MSKQELVEQNMRLVYHILYSYYPSFVNDEDILQVGMLGLCQAADTWDKSKGIKFSTYACVCISNAIKYEFRKQRRQIPTISLDKPLDEDECVETLGDMVVGEADVEYLDTEPLYVKLTPTEKKVFDLLKQGLAQVDISNRLNLSKQRINQIIRHIRKKWRYNME